MPTVEEMILVSVFSEEIGEDYEDAEEIWYDISDASSLFIAGGTSDDY